VAHAGLKVNPWGAKGVKLLSGNTQ